MDEATVEWLHEVLLRIEWTYNAASFVACLYFVHCISRITLLHANLRIQICSIALQYMMIFMTRIADKLNRLWDKDVLTTNVLCMLLRVFNVIGILGAILTLLNTATERLIATVLTETYERRGYAIGIAIVANTIVWGVLVAILTIIYDVNSGHFDVRTSRTSCLLNNIHPQTIPLAWIIATGFWILGTTVFSLLYQYNKKQRRGVVGQTLSTRYQYYENEVSTRLLIPIVALYGLMLIPGTSLAIYTSYHMMGREQEALTLLYTQILFMLADSYQLIFVLYVSTKFPPMCAIIRRDVQRIRNWLFGLPNSVGDEAAIATVSGDRTKKKPAVVDDYCNSEAHFAELDRFWNTVAVKKERSASSSHCRRVAKFRDPSHGYLSAGDKSVVSADDKSVADDKCTSTDDEDEDISPTRDALRVSWSDRWKE